MPIENEHRPDSTQPAHPPLCRRCHRRMIFAAAEPDLKYKNLDVYHFDCGCGASTSARVARNIEQRCKEPESPPAQRR
jgi:hypothetical protein